MEITRLLEKKMFFRGNPDNMDGTPAGRLWNDTYESIYIHKALLTNRRPPHSIRTSQFTPPLVP